jgi:hypothetical protein
MSLSILPEDCVSKFLPNVDIDSQVDMMPHAVGSQCKYIGNGKKVKLSLYLVMP